MLSALGLFTNTERYAKILDEKHLESRTAAKKLDKEAPNNQAKIYEPLANFQKIRFLTLLKHHEKKQKQTCDKASQACINIGQQLIGNTFPEKKEFTSHFKALKEIQKKDEFRNPQTDQQQIIKTELDKLLPSLPVTQIDTLIEDEAIRQLSREKIIGSMVIGLSLGCVTTFVLNRFKLGK